MIAYTIVGSNYLEQGAAFYDEILGLLGAKRVMDFDRGHSWAVEPDQPMFGIMKPFNESDATIGNGSMISLKADSSTTVDGVYAKAIELGGADEGAPGERTKGFYAAYFRDLDGNKLCVCHIDVSD